MAKEIPLTQGKFAIVDDEDFEYINQWKWYYMQNHGNEYALRGERRGGKYKNFFMHRVIIKTPIGMETDHINGNGLDNRRINLRICTNRQNQHNAQLRSDSTSGFKGVHFNKRHKKYLAHIGTGIGGKKKGLGYFKTAEEAAHAYDDEAKKQFGEFAKLNFPQEDQ